MGWTQAPQTMRPSKSRLSKGGGPAGSVTRFWVQASGCGRYCCTTLDVGCLKHVNNGIFTISTGAGLGKFWRYCSRWWQLIFFKYVHLCLGKWSNLTKFFRWVETTNWCWWKKSCTTWDVKKHLNNGIFTISTGAWFLPSTVPCGNSSDHQVFEIFCCVFLWRIPHVGWPARVQCLEIWTLIFPILPSVILGWCRFGQGVFFGEGCGSCFTCWLTGSRGYEAM